MWPFASRIDWHLQWTAQPAPGAAWTLEAEVRRRGPRRRGVFGLFDAPPCDARVDEPLRIEAVVRTGAPEARGQRFVLVVPGRVCPDLRPGGRIRLHGAGDRCHALAVLP